MSSHSLLRIAPLALAAALATASAGCDDPAAAVRVPRVRSIYILPLGGVLNPGASGQMQIQVDAEPGADTTVRWSSASSPAGSISPTGFLRACFPGGVMTVAAASVADPTKVDTLPVAVGTPPLGWAAVSGFSRPNPSTPHKPADFVDPGAANGEVEVEVLVSASLMAGRCRAVELVEIHLTGATTQIVLARFLSPTPFAEDRRFRARLPTTAVPDGDYQLGGSVHLTGVPTPYPVLPLRVRIRNH